MKKSSGLVIVALLLSLLLLISVGLNIYLISEYSKLRAERSFQEEKI